MYIQITTRCNMSCEHCCYRCGKEGKDMNRKVFNAALRLAEDYGHYISLGGGEPTLHQKFWEYLGKSIAASEQIWLATNGSQTETAIALAKMAKAGVLGVALSLDPYHDEIDERVEMAFNVRGYDMRGRASAGPDDMREIRDVSMHVINAGRALDNGIGDTEDVCVCDDMLVDPDGTIWSCGCKKICFGTVFDPMIPEGYGGDLWDGNYCAFEYMRNNGLDEDELEMPEGLKIAA